MSGALWCLSLCAWLTTITVTVRVLQFQGINHITVMITVTVIIFLGINTVIYLAQMVEPNMFHKWFEDKCIQGVGLR